MKLYTSLLWLRRIKHVRTSFWLCTAGFELVCLHFRFQECQVWTLDLTYRPHSSSFLGLPYRILNMNSKKELLWGLWVDFSCFMMQHCLKHTLFAPALGSLGSPALTKS